MKYLKEKGLHRFLSDDYIELAYITTGITGLSAMVEFPSDWHERKRGWVRIGLGLIGVAVSFPWKWTVPDHYQCSGPTYGFQFYEDIFWLRYGKDKGTRDDPRICIYMPWHWRHSDHFVLSEPQTHSYTYTLKSGVVQERTATIKVETRKWTRFWIPFKRTIKSIDITFNDEVGERSGSWKGGCIGCSYEMLPNETPLQTLRRMELERKF